jgi:hypothetical protein
MSPYGPQVLEGCEMIKWAKRRVYLQLVEGIGGWWALTNIMLSATYPSSKKE